MKIEITLNHEKCIFEGDDQIVQEAVRQFIDCRFRPTSVTSLWNPQPPNAFQTVIGANNQ